MLGLLVYTAPVPETSRAKSSLLSLIGQCAIAPRVLTTLGCAGSLWLGMAAAAIAGPVMLDGSTNSTILDAVTSQSSDCSTSCLIQGSDQAGGNLYHSFSEFDVLSGVTVTLDGQGLERILMRVTGGQRTDINGLLQVQGDADLFLLNPNGLTIGVDGRLDISGSFIGSTAEFVIFENDDIFTTTDNNAPLLSLSVPSGLQFGSGSTGTFRVEGNANQPSVWQSGTIGQTFALVVDSSNTASFSQRSHAVTAGGFVLANAGAGPQQVNLQKVAEGWDFDFSNVPQVRAVQLDQAQISTELLSPGGIVELDGRITLTNSEISLQSQNGIAAGEFQARGESLTLNNSIIESQTDAGGGDINLLMEVDGKELILQSGSQISTTSSLGEAGNINFDGGTLRLNNSSITTETQDGGGNISLSASKTLELRNDSLISVESNDAGTVGNIEIETLGSAGFQLNNSKILLEVQTSGGNISITSPSQIIFNRGELIASTESAGANVSFSTNGSLRLNREDLISINSGDGTYAGTGGNLAIEASQVYSAGRDTDIKVVGPVGNFSTVISNSREFGGFSGGQEVIRGNGRSEIQITELPPFPEPEAPPVSKNPLPESPELPEILEILAIPEIVDISDIPVPSSSFVTSPITVTPSITAPITYVSEVPVAPTSEQSDVGREEDTRFPFLFPFLGGGSEENDELALGAGNSNSAYRSRRPGCESKMASETQGRLRISGRGGLPARPGSLMTSAQPLADLGSPGFVVGRRLDGNLRGDWPSPAGNNQMETGGQPKLREAGGWQMTASGKIQLLAGSQAHAMGSPQPCHLKTVVSMER